MVGCVTVIGLLLNMFLLKLSAPYTGILKNTCLWNVGWQNGRVCLG